MRSYSNNIINAVRLREKAELDVALGRRDNSNEIYKTIPMLENEKKYLLNKEIKLNESINFLKKELDNFNSQKTSSIKKPLEEALKTYTSEKTFFLHSILVGDEQYIELNDINPENNIESHIVSAKQGSKKPIHIKLRQFGYLNEFNLIKEFQNEILGLVSEIIQIKKQKPSLNENRGGLSNNYKIVEDLNEFNENIYFVIDRNLEKIHENKVSLSKEIEEKLLEVKVIPSKILLIEREIKDKKIFNLKEKKYNTLKNKWNELLKKNNAKKLILTDEDGFVEIGIQFLLHLKYPENSINEDLFKKKITELEDFFKNKKNNKNRVLLENFNQNLLEIHTEYNKAILEIDNLDNEFGNVAFKERSVISKLMQFDFEHSAGKQRKLTKLQNKANNLYTNAKQKQDKQLLDLLNSLYEQKISKKLISSYQISSNKLIIMLKNKQKPAVSQLKLNFLF